MKDKDGKQQNTNLPIHPSPPPPPKNTVIVLQKVRQQKKKEEMITTEYLIEGCNTKELSFYISRQKHFFEDDFHWGVKFRRTSTIFLCENGEFLDTNYYKKFQSPTEALNFFKGTGAYKRNFKK